MRLLPFVAAVALSAAILSECVGATDAHETGDEDTMVGNREHRIKHILVLMLENRAFDHFFGRFPGVDGLTGMEFNRVNATDPNSERVFVSADAPYSNMCDPDHSLPGTSYKIFGPKEFASGNLTTPTMSGFVEQEWVMDGFGKGVQYCNVMQGFTPERLPVISTLASEFAIMDKFFASVPGPTWPNRAFALTGTSSGLTETGVWYQNQMNMLLPSKTIYDLIDEGYAPGMWRHYYNDTPWEIFIQKIAHNTDHVFNMDQFYQDAAEGNLPYFGFINPRCGINMTTMEGSNDDHPDHDVALGEQFVKDIYEALRSSPQWNRTLLIITFDEHGGFYDHVPPPMEGVPPPDDIASFPDEGFRFDRLGMRIPAILVSPWIEKGVVVSEPPPAQKPFPTSQYELTSIIATARKLLRELGGSKPLTKRDAWAATFEHLIWNSTLDQPRTDCPLHLPNAPKPSRSPEVEAHLPINGLQRDILAAHAHSSGRHAANTTGHLQRQKELSHFLHNHFEEHKARVSAWKLSKRQPSYDLKLASPKLPFVTQVWNMSASSSPRRFVVFSTLVGNETWCMTANASSPNPVFASLCFPSAEADRNQDAEQQWSFDSVDSSLRPASDHTQCMTSLYFSDSVHHAYLRPCNGRPEQAWAYNGTAAGQLPITTQPGAFFAWGPYVMALMKWGGDVHP